MRRSGLGERPAGMCRRAMATCAAVCALALAPPSRADVVELRTGQRVEGVFKGADDGSVRIEVDGRLMAFPPAEVRAIYYGPAPAATAPLPELGEAIGALSALRAVARPGVSYREYAPRVSEAGSAVDRYLKREDGAPAVKGAVADSFQLYALARTAWSAGLGGGNYAAVGSDPAIGRCGEVQRVLDESRRRNPFAWRSKGAGEAATAGRVIAEDGIAALWACASDRLAQAEKLLAEKGR